MVRAQGRQRDHRSRNSWPALLFLMVEGMFRELLGPARILGNHVVIDRGDGVYAVLAHLQRGSVRVGKGDAIRAGQVVAGCGNTGNTTEPHLHVQLMEHPNVLFAAGLPMAFGSFEVDGQTRNGLPANSQPFVAAPAVPSGTGDEQRS